MTIEIPRNKRIDENTKNKEKNNDLSSLMNPLLSYSINLQFCLAMQCIGAGVSEADLIAAFLNINARCFHSYFTKTEEYLSYFERNAGKEQVATNLEEEIKLSPEDNEGNKQIASCTDTMWQK